MCLHSWLTDIKAPELVFSKQILKRDDDYDTFKVTNRIRNGHACIMSIVFIILYPLGAMSIHLPIDRISFLRNTYLRNKVPAIHMPIQILATVLMIVALGLGIRLAHDLRMFEEDVPTHVIIGLVVVCVLILFQPVAGMVQHRYFKKTGGRSVFAYIHRWLGRAAILLGIINNGLGFQLAEDDIEVPKGSYIRNAVIAGVLCLIWLGLVIWDEFLRVDQPRATVDGGEKGMGSDREVLDSEPTHA
jgi:hypothetical protein